MTLRLRIEALLEREGLELSLDAYAPELLERLVEVVESYLEGHARPDGGNRWKLRRRPGRARVPPLLLSGPVGTGKTTLMMLLDRALPEASPGSIFQQEIPGHPTARATDGERLCIEVRPLALMGEARNIPTGVIRLGELRRLYRLTTYDRERSRSDPEAQARFAALLKNRIVYVDEFVPDDVSPFPMKVINFLADHGILVVLSSNRRETPFVEGVRVVAVEGEDMRRGELGRISVGAGPDPRFDRLAALPERRFDHVARGLRARVDGADGRRVMLVDFDVIAHVPADWLAFQHLLQYTDRLLVDDVPVFDPARHVGVDAARRFVLLVDALYDERRPLLLRLTQPEPLAEGLEASDLTDRYPAELLVDLERALSRLRQLSTLAG